MLYDEHLRQDYDQALLESKNLRRRSDIDPFSSSEFIVTDEHHEVTRSERK